MNFYYQSLAVFRPVVKHHNKFSVTSGVILSALPVVINGPYGCVECLAFLDDGSTGSNASCSKKDRTSKLCNLTVSGGWEIAEQYCMEGVRTVKELDLDVRVFAAYILLHLHDAYN